MTQENCVTFLLVKPCIDMLHMELTDPDPTLNKKGDGNTAHC